MDNGNPKAVPLFKMIITRPPSATVPRVHREEPALHPQGRSARDNGESPFGETVEFSHVPLSISDDPGQWG